MFSFKDIFNYPKEGRYPDNSDKTDKRYLRKQASYFIVTNTSYHYIGSGNKYITTAMYITTVTAKYFTKWAGGNGTTVRVAKSRCSTAS